MKIVRWTAIEAAAANRLPGYIEAVKAAGQREGPNIILTDAAWQTLRDRFTPPLTAETIAQRVSQCGSCKWNVEWICEHPGCRPCRQRKAGGLKSALQSPYFTCPAGKF